MSTGCHQRQDAAEPAFVESTPSYSDIQHHLHDNGAAAGHDQLHSDHPPSRDHEPPYSAFRFMSTQDVVAVSQQLYSHTTSLGLTATLELESDTVEIYDSSNDGFQYSLKGTVELDWIADSELLLKDARIDFMGYADTAVLRYEAGAGGATETPVHHTHDYIPTPMILGSAPPTPSSFAPVKPIGKYHDSLPIDLTLPGHLPDSTDLAIGKIRYELQISLELTFAQGTSTSVTEQFILRRPVLIHRIVYPSVHLQPRLAMGLDSGGVEIQIKVPRLLHCENTLLAVELYAKPRTRNVRLRKAKIVFEQIETDRYQRTSSLAAVPRAVVPLATSAHSSAVSPRSQHASLPTPYSAGPPPAPRLLTRAIAQPLEVYFEEPTEELQRQTLNLQLVLSPDFCVDVQSNWLQVSHALRVEIEYTTDEDTYAIAPPSSIPPLSVLGSDLPKALEEQGPVGQEMVAGAAPSAAPEGRQEEQDAAFQGDQKQEPTLWDQEGDTIEIEIIGEDEEATGMDLEDKRPRYVADEKGTLQDGEGSGSSTVASRHHLQRDESSRLLEEMAPPLSEQLKDVSQLSTPTFESEPSAYGCSVATEEIPVRVVRVVSTALVDASTLAQAAGETEAGLPTYESVIEATGLPAYAEEKLEDDHGEAEASGTAMGVLGGAARRLEGEDAEVERR
ncbi:hypothetical protein BC939DRAFT_466785 [Gamsiella multidivaricata]|uniref:uncharacterized protein n=1 Tax=Gamsiella multidivaricata TaxID=101098 RepID=UPI00221E3C12|nr:uncharacterized protein BC939DRAFT_466785 [Gamsiella multidivaricata]KAI7817137.1 hypothetical protein BC939DRAFT_466785 [Gamsiella multidivaricata]